MKYVNLFFTKKCNLFCYRGRDGYSCISGCQEPNADKKTEPEVGPTIDWLSKFAKNSSVHITGGEPCMRPDLMELVGGLLERKHRVSLDTNGLLLKNHTGLNELPVAFHVTWHRHQVSKELFVNALRGYDTEQMLISAIIPRETDPPFDIESELGIDAWGSNWIIDRVGFMGIQACYRTGSPNKHMMFIGQDGSIHPCSKPYHEYGSIYRQSLDFKRAMEYECPEKLFPKRCYAFQTMDLMEQIHDTM